MAIFEGNTTCSLCKRELPSEKYFGVSLSGYTHTFCANCFKNNKNGVKNILHDEK